MKLYLGGFPGAGKTTLARWLSENGWHRLDFDLESPTSRADQLTALTPDHPDLDHPQVVAEGGFLDKAPEFQKMFDRVEFVPVWLTGTRQQLRNSRLARGDAAGQLVGDWVALVESHRKKVQWSFEVSMWDADGQRKTCPKVVSEILQKVPGGITHG